MNSQAIFILSIILSFLSYVLIARWYLMPVLNRLSLTAALTPLLILHSFRHIGLAFLVPGVVSPDLAPAFAVPAAYGDLLASVLAFLALAALHLRLPLATLLVWFFNIEGTLDLLVAPFQGFSHAHPEQMGAMYFVPAFLVPALLVTHIIIFILLLRSTDAKTGSARV